MNEQSFGLGPSSTSLLPPYGTSFTISHLVQHTSIFIGLPAYSCTPSNPSSTKLPEWALKTQTRPQPSPSILSPVTFLFPPKKFQLPSVWGPYPLAQTIHHGVFPGVGWRLQWVCWMTLGLPRDGIQCHCHHSLSLYKSSFFPKALQRKFG